MSTSPNQTAHFRDHLRDLNRDQCADACAPMESPKQTAATPEHRLASAIGGWVHEALRGEGLELVERDSPRAIWHSTLTRASIHGDGAGVAALLAAGQRHGWLS